MEEQKLELQLTLAYKHQLDFFVKYVVTSVSYQINSTDDSYLTIDELCGLTFGKMSLPTHWIAE